MQRSINIYEVQFCHFMWNARSCFLNSNMEISSPQMWYHSTFEFKPNCHYYFFQASFMLSTWEISWWHGNKLKNTTFIRSGVVNTGLKPMQKTSDDDLSQLIMSYFLPNTLKAFCSYSFCSLISSFFHTRMYTPVAYHWLYICVGSKGYDEGQGSGVHMAYLCLSVRRI